MKKNYIYQGETLIITPSFEGIEIAKDGTRYIIDGNIIASEQIRINLDKPLTVCGFVLAGKSIFSDVDLYVNEIFTGTVLQISGQITSTHNIIAGWDLEAHKGIHAIKGDIISGGWITCPKGNIDTLDGIIEARKEIYIGKNYSVINATQPDAIFAPAIKKLPNR